MKTRNNYDTEPTTPTPAKPKFDDDGELITDPISNPPTSADIKVVEMPECIGMTGCTIPNGFINTADGLYYDEVKVQGAGKDRVFTHNFIRLTGPFCITARTRDFRSGNTGKVLEWVTEDGEPKRKIISDSLLSGSNASQSFLDTQLRSEGLWLSEKLTDRKHFLTFLNNVGVGPTARMVNKVGFNQDGGSFILPDHDFSNGGEKVYFSKELNHKYNIKGSLEEWKENICRHANHNSRMTFAIACAFAGPLFTKLGTRAAGGFHIYQGSSNGKSVVCFAAGSVWGGPKFSHTWNNTALKLEHLAASHNDTLLVLDEMTQAQAATVAHVAYVIGNGMNKGGLQRNSESREELTWNVLLLSSGEKSMPEQLKDGGEKVNSGQEVRIADIPMTPQGNEYGWEHFSTFKTESNSDAEAMRDMFIYLVDAAENRYYGSAGDAYVRQLLLQDAYEWEKLKEWKTQWATSHTPAGASAQVGRVIDRFATVALGAHLASIWNIATWTSEAGQDAVSECLEAWLAQRGTTGSGEQEKAVTNLNNYLQTNSSKFQSVDTVPLLAPRDRAGWVDDPFDPRYYMFTAKAFDDMSNSMSRHEAVRQLLKLNILVPSGKGKQAGKPYQSRKINRVTQRVYVVDHLAMTTYMTTGEIYTGRQDDVSASIQLDTEWA